MKTSRIKANPRSNWPGQRNSFRAKTENQASEKPSLAEKPYFKKIRFSDKTQDLPVRKEIPAEKDDRPRYNAARPGFGVKRRLVFKPRQREEEMPDVDPLEEGLRRESRDSRTSRWGGARPSGSEELESQAEIQASEDRMAMQIAAEVIGKASRENPADGVLREALQAARGLGARSRASAAHLVFNYYRWLNWLNPDAPMNSRLTQAWELKKRFDANPQSFSFDELKSKAVPEWAADHILLDEKWLQCLQKSHQLWIRARPGTGVELAKTLGSCLPAGVGHLDDALAYSGRADLFRTPEFHQGAFEVQDLSSQAVSIICDPQPGQTWWDACAGEGGKTLHLAGLMKNRGLIWASDKAEWRLQKLKRRAARAGLFNYRTVAWDNLDKPPVKTLFDGVLVDAPCSGAGTWGRNPHARWTTSVADVQELAELQSRLLSCAAGSVKPGGKLVYAVCTLTRDETVEVAKAFQEKFTDFKPLAGRNPLEPEAVSAAQHWLGPPACNSNGMFVAVWRKG